MESFKRRIYEYFWKELFRLGATMTKYSLFMKLKCEGEKT